MTNPYWHKTDAVLEEILADIVRGQLGGEWAVAELVNRLKDTKALLRETANAFVPHDCELLDRVELALEDGET